MTEMAKTLLFVAVAACSLAVAYWMGPTSEVQDFDELIGTRLNQFELDVAKRLKIVKFDQETASTREFEVAETDGLWSIPSKQGYPADAARQMAEAATCLIDREVLRVAGKSANDHEALGVIDPSSSKLDSKAEGVGIRVTITDSNDAPLTDMIIGKAVKEAEGQYYVRNVDQDVVYVVNLDPDKLSTKFEDWIEDDLLKLNPMDIRRVKIKDYSAELHQVLTSAGFQMRVQWDRRGEMTLSYDSKESKWHAEQLQQLDPEKKELVDYELAEDEELNEETLKELRNSLGDLLLVDVARKPAGLSAELKAGGDFLKNQDAATSLMERGFAPISLAPDAPPEILSTEGELVCSLQDGVEYVLRFGNLQIGEEGETASDKKSGEEGDEENSETSDGINRYLFVMARFNESMLEKPEPTELPELPASEEDSSETASEEDSETKESEESAPGEPASAGGEPEDKEAENKEAEEGTEEESTPEEENEEETVEKTAEKTKKEIEREALIAARALIEKENVRQLNEYEEKLKAGKEKVAELNHRFGDWYYVISNDVFKKIHLGRDEVIKKKESETEATDSNAGPGAGAPTGGLPGLPNLPIGGAN
ncbi:MAG: DUF4340 domain-containing protein [Planctomycetes bacterium]|nr:DUF4340 domain-containing protein [Planctomycetota bacterium]